MDSKAIDAAIRRNKDKLERQKEALAATQAELQILEEALAKAQKKL